MRSTCCLAESGRGAPKVLRPAIRRDSRRLASDRPLLRVIRAQCPEQTIRSEPIDGDTNDLSDQRIRTIEMHGLQVGRASGELTRTPPRLLDEHLHAAPEAVPIEGRLLRRKQLLQ